MKRQKEYALTDYAEMIKHAWTFEKLTEKEQRNFLDLIYSSRIELRGDYHTRWMQLQGVWSGFLSALEYYENPVDWRATPEELENNPRF